MSTYCMFGRASADYEEKLMMKQEAAELLYGALKSMMKTADAVIAEGKSGFDFGKGHGGSYDEALQAIAFAEGRS